MEEPTPAKLSRAGSSFKRNANNTPSNISIFFFSAHSLLLAEIHVRPITLEGGGGTLYNDSHLNFT